MDWDKPREATPAANDHGVRYWERHYTNTSTLIVAFLSVPVFVAAIGIAEAVLFGGDPFQNWQRGLTVASAIGLFVSCYLWLINHRRIIAVTDTTLHLGDAHLPFELVGPARLLSQEEEHKIYRETSGKWAFLPTALMVLAIRNNNITLMAPRYMPHKVLIETGMRGTYHMVAVRDPEQFLAALERGQNLSEVRRQQRWQAT